MPEPTGRKLHHVEADELLALHDRHGAVYPRGRVIYRQGETSDELYVVLRGSVEFFVQDGAASPVPVALAEPGQYFGELGCFGREPRRTAAVVREDDTALLIFNQTSAIALLRESPRFALEIVNSLATRLLALDVENAHLRRENGARAGATSGAGPQPSAVGRPFGQ